MECRIASRRCAKETVAIGIHPLGARIDPTVAHPWRISDDDVEAAFCHHVREVDVVGKEIELTIFGAMEKLPRLGDARVQLAASRQVRRAHAAKQIALRRSDLLQLPIIDLNRFVQQLGGHALIVTANHSRQRGTIFLRSAAIPRNEVRLRAQGRHPFAIDISAAIAEEIGRTQERVALQDVAIEIRKRRDVFDRNAAFRNDRQP